MSFLEPLSDEGIPADILERFAHYKNTRGFTLIA